MLRVTGCQHYLAGLLAIVEEGSALLLTQLGCSQAHAGQLLLTKGSTTGSTAVSQTLVTPALYVAMSSASPYKQF